MLMPAPPPKPMAPGFFMAPPAMPVPQANFVYNRHANYVHPAQRVVTEADKKPYTYEDAMKLFAIKSEVEEKKKDTTKRTQMTTA